MGKSRRPRTLVLSWWLFQPIIQIVVFLPAVASAQEKQKEEIPLLPQIAPAFRDCLDRLAADQKLEPPAEQDINFAGNITAWFINQFPLAADEEFRLARTAHEKLEKKVKLLSPSPPAKGLFEKLLGKIPAHLQPKPFKFELFVIDSPKFNAFTNGAGQVYVNKGLVGPLLAQKERGHEALAFLLARELGHICLEHCRIGYQRKQIQEELKAGIKLHIKEAALEKILQTTVAPVGLGVKFLYSREQEYAADLFAFHLCRNAEFNLDHCLEALRFFIVLEYPRLLEDPKYDPKLTERSPLIAYLHMQPPSLWRLARLQMESAGKVPGDQFGLFLVHRKKGNFSRARDQSVGKEPALVFVHGMLGGENTFNEFLAACRKNPALADLPLLVFRYPNNSSFARSGEFLAKEMTRVVTDPRQTLFVCHSAGGLVVRYYAERKQGPLSYAVFLGTPNQGSSLRPMKFLVDAFDFAGATFKIGLPETVAKNIPEGKGEIGNDLEPDSLFLRYLGQNADLARRYHLIYGQVFRGPGGILLKISLIQVLNQLRPLLLKLADEQLENGKIAANAKTIIRRFTIPDEILNGDLIVSVASARLAGANEDPVTGLNHAQLLTDPDLIRRVMEILVDKLRKP